MRTFKKFDRKDKFTWAKDDVEHHKVNESLVEYTHDNPHQRENPIPDWGNRPQTGSPEHNSFSKHHDSLDNIEKAHIRKYKGSSANFNHYLRHGKTRVETKKGLHSDFDREYNKAEIKGHEEHDKHMMKVTSHKIEHHHTVYRSGIPGDEKRFPAGHKFTDHGYAGTSFHKGIAEGFSQQKSNKRKSIIHVIHVHPGVKGHYLDVHGGPLSDEHELLLQRGTKFKVTHHSEDRDNHYIHSRVVSQNARKLPGSKE